ncbi:MAG: lipocalin family protein [Chitinivibrionales bacterium]|nr:lipocalin family protein [Chitinivibrionales bacterium]
MKFIAAAVCFLAIVILLLSCKKQANQFTPVTGFDLNKYLGTWYEIARLPNSFEKGLERVTATYSLKDNAKVVVDNRGLKNGKPARAVGKAIVAGAPDQGYLKVSFFGPFYADYIILDLDKNYSYAMVASSNKYLWILSRTPLLGKETIDSLVTKAGKLGFDTGKLFFTPQQ